MFAPTFIHQPESITDREGIPVGEVSSCEEQGLVLALVHSAEHAVGYDLHLDLVMHSAQQRRVNNNDSTTHCELS